MDLPRFFLVRRIPVTQKSCRASQCSTASVVSISCPNLPVTGTMAGGGLTWKVLSSKDGGAAVSFKGPHNNRKSIDQKRYTFPSDETSGVPPFEARYIRQTTSTPHTAATQHAYYGCARRIFLETKADWGMLICLCCVESSY